MILKVLDPSAPATRPREKATSNKSTEFCFSAHTSCIGARLPLTAKTSKDTPRSGFVHGEIAGQPCRKPNPSLGELGFSPTLITLITPVTPLFIKDYRSITKYCADSCY